MKRETIIISAILMMVIYSAICIIGLHTNWAIAEICRWIAIGVASLSFFSVLILFMILQIARIR